MKIRPSFIILVLFLIVSFSSEADAQRKKKRKRPSKRENVEPKQSPLLQNMNYEIKIGNINAYNGYFHLSTKLNAGYKITKQLSSGIGTKFYYAYNFYSKQSANLLEGFAYARFSILKQFYLQAEYNTTLTATSEQKLNYPAFGGGYMGFIGEKWSYGTEILYQHREVRSSTDVPLEYWVTLSYNF